MEEAAWGHVVQPLFHRTDFLLPQIRNLCRNQSGGLGYKGAITSELIRRHSIRS